MNRFFSVSDINPTWSLTFCFILCLSFHFIFTAICYLFAVSHYRSQKLVGHFRLDNNASWNQANFRTYLLLSIRLDKFYIKWNGCRQLRYCFFARKENLICPTISSFGHRFSIKNIFNYWTFLKLL